MREDDPVPKKIQNPLSLKLVRRHLADSSPPSASGCSIIAAPFEPGDGSIASSIAKRGRIRWRNAAPIVHLSEFAIAPIERDDDVNGGRADGAGRSDDKDPWLK